MAGEDYDGHDEGYVPEDPNFPQNHCDEHDVGTVIDDSGFPQLLPDEHGGINLGEDVNPPEIRFDGHEHDDGGFPGNTDYPQQEHIEEHYGTGDVTENFDHLQEQGSEIDSKGNEIQRWPGWPGENVFRMLVMVQKVGSIIGRKGEFIKKITEETKARIKILDGPPGTSERAVMVSAKEEPDRLIPPAVDGLLRVHKQVINVDADSTYGAGCSVVTRLLVADTQAGSLIGKQGSTIKSIQDASGCTIRVLGSENLPVFALPDDSIVEIQGESAGVHKAVELIAIHLRKFLVDRSIVGVFETRMQRPDVRVNQNAPPHQTWGPPPQGFPAPGGGPSFAPNHQYMPPSHHYDNYYPTADLPSMDKHLHQGPPPAYARDASMGIHSSSTQPQQSAVTKVTQHMQIPLSYADAVIGASGTNISYIRRASGASITIQETRGVPGEMTVEISGTTTQIQAAQQLVQNFMAEAANAQQDHMGGSGYNAYPTNAPLYTSPPSSADGHIGYAPSADYGPLYGTNYGY
ncbi:flowering locus K homology domain-like [Gastrolobium bilobum]|uniref:flowering locus K homology domain-like n=1 Tax=Gastrolobium bilobum TaxID=150636 RepID=UPI002AAF8DFA|nr:flowering locus K homology domain-like [Gastrolobium bilobum]XP_061354010.1 flowering locus K homology domain-like [Gastrolobium bilobum]